MARMIDCAFSQLQSGRVSSWWGRIPEGCLREMLEQAVLRVFMVASADLWSHTRGCPRVAFARQVAMYLCKRLTAHSFPEIGRELGGKHHTTVMHSVDKIDLMTRENQNFHKQIEELIDNICN